MCSVDDVDEFEVDDNADVILFNSFKLVLRRDSDI
ncbi:unnamed protein product [Schistosoma mattheei]|uniref:Uncharacterized protein n=1 Tax=Schistosoma mattheei TaxID=31246 RepID=A0A183PHG7_9TREM|nr:unnamed protein product [Schistosoma mattheei]